MPQDLRAPASATNPHAPMNPVLQLIRERVTTGSEPGSRADHHRLALVIEGGGMRGVVSAGMVTALHYLGSVSAFDAVFGSSAGAINGAYFLAHQAPYGTTIYYDDINNHRFLRPIRVLLRRPGMSLDYLFGEVIRGRKPLDVHAVLASRIPLWVVATSVQDCAPVAWSDFRDGDDLLGALQASSQFPGLSGGPFPYRGGTYFDGGIVSQLAYRQATEQGYTHILALVTGSSVAHWYDPLLSVVSAVYMTQYGLGLARAVASRARRNREDRAHLRGGEGNKGGGPLFCGIAVGDRGVVRRTEIRTERLIAAARRGFRAVYEAFGVEVPVAVPVFVPHEKNGRAVKEQLREGEG